MVLLFDLTKLMGEIHRKFGLIIYGFHFQSAFQKVNIVTCFPMCSLRIKKPCIFPYIVAHAPSFMFGQGSQYYAAASQSRPDAAAAGTVSNQNSRSL